MARLTLVAVAARLPGWAEAACAEYAARMPRAYAFERIAVKPAARATGAPIAKLLAAEAARVGERLPREAIVVALDERGRDFSTREFAHSLRAWAEGAAPVAFVVGGADGLDAGFKRHAALQLRLSSLTLPHALAQVVLCEQLYRAASLLAGHPYHRD